MNFNKCFYIVLEKFFQSLLSFNGTHSFLHSLGTSHVWAFGAIAEFIDNAKDEGATEFCINVAYADDDVKKEKPILVVCIHKY